MSVEGDEPNSRAPAERNVECYLVAFCNVSGLDLLDLSI